MKTIHPVGSRPQAFVKIVPGGGTKNAARIKQQMKYLGRDGEVDLERSERYQGIAVDANHYDDVAEAWYQQAQNKLGGTTNQLLTTHIIVSFPAETDLGNAKRAARSWAEEMFGSGNNGGTFDYMTAFHTDKPHPHLHVMVNQLDERSRGRESLGR